jgi:hypothetical protein
VWDSFIYTNITFIIIVQHDLFVCNKFIFTTLLHKLLSINLISLYKDNINAYIDSSPKLSSIKGNKLFNSNNKFIISIICRILR